jgi:large repetitive protein
LTRYRYFATFDRQETGMGMPLQDHVRKVRRLRFLYDSLKGTVSPAAGRAVMAGAATLALAACPPPTTAQKADNPSFAAPVQNPFGFQHVVAGTFPVAPAFVDINGDGVADLFAGAGGEAAGVIKYYANTGSKTSPSFAAGVDYPGLTNSTTHVDLNPVPVLAPLRSGAPWDVLIGHGPGGSPSLQYYQNTGSAFSSQPSPPSALPSIGGGLGSSLTATAVDINGDGLLDVFVSSSNGSVNTIDYFKNMGPASAPVFADQHTSLGLDLPAGSIYGYPTFVDIDANGTYDAFVGDDHGNIYFFKNVGTPTAPQFAAPVKNPFGITPVPAGPAVPAFVDIDGDGDFDLFVGDGNGDLWFYRNKNF